MKTAFRALLGPVLLVAILALTLLLFGLPVMTSLGLIAKGALGDQFGVSRTIVKSTPLIFTGVALVIAWRAGMYNIGGEGQFVIGGLFGASCAHFMVPLSVPENLKTVSILVCCAIGGAVWAFVPGWLQTKRGVEVVISTILLNFIAFQTLSYAINGPLQESQHQLPYTDALPDSVMLTGLSRQTDVHSGTVLAVLVAILAFYFLFFTKRGFEIRLAGSNLRVARSNRIDYQRAQLQAMVISGAICGLAGGVEYVGIAGRIGGGFAQGWGFLGIPVALLSGLHPLGAMVSALYFGALLAGTQNLAGFTSGGTTLVFVVQGAAVLAFVGLRAWQERRPKAVAQGVAA